MKPCSRCRRGRHEECLGWTMAAGEEIAHHWTVVDCACARAGHVDPRLTAERHG